MKRARLAVGPLAAPVINPERGVGHLLDLGEQNARADRVHGAGLDQDAISRRGLERVNEVLDLAGMHGRREFVGADAAFQSGVNPASGFSVKDHPGFGFAVVICQPPACFVVGMDLNRE